MDGPELVVTDALREAELREFLTAHLARELLRFTAVGSVDDGKSTLLGRLLHDTRSIYDDQLAGIRASRFNRAGTGFLDLSLLTDGLRAEREQGITIDVAYRYFSTARRKFILADTPGHVEYTRNMATGASTADVAIVLIDAKAFVEFADGVGGLQPQTRRHTYIASVLRVPHVVVAVNKMDLVGYSEALFHRIAQEYRLLAAHMDIAAVEFIPVSALHGDNVVESSSAMPWYTGPTLLEYLETVPLQRIAPEREPMRFPVQLVMHPKGGSRGYAGQVARGVIKQGMLVKALPGGQVTRIKTIGTYDGDLQFAASPRNVTLELEDEIVMARGDMLVEEAGAGPCVSTRFRAMVVWMHETPLTTGSAYLLKHTTRTVKATARHFRFAIDLRTFEPHASDELAMNDIAEMEFELDEPLFFDSYAGSREMGSFILIDLVSHATAGAGMVLAHQ